VVDVAVFDIPAGGGPLEIGIELDAVGWIKINALNLAFKAFPFGEACHNLEAVPQDHAVRPVLIVLVELGFIYPFGDAVEVGKKIYLAAFSLAVRFGPAEQIINKHLWLDLFLNVEGRSVDHKV
jgi:hypothetical protein